MPHVIERDRYMHVCNRNQRQKCDIENTFQHLDSFNARTMGFHIYANNKLKAVNGRKEGASRRDTMM